MAALVQILVVLLSFYFRSGTCLEIQSLKLTGGRGEYIDVNSGLSYTLSCTYRSGYDDPVYKVTWYLHGSRVYEWTTTTDDISASGVLLGRVDTSPQDEPGSLHFTKLDYFLAGNYTVQVTSSLHTVQMNYYLRVVDISPIPYDTNVHILKDSQQQSEGASEDNRYVTYDLSLQPAENEDAVEFEDAQCTLVWSFKTPAIFPRPNVTCGYYSFNHDEVVYHLPAGLTMHKFLNESWQASFDSTKVPVSSIPLSHRLACSVKIPDTTYREIVMTEDDFTVDNLIDSAGCPALDHLTTRNGLIVEPRDTTVNCRGNFLPNNREAPAVVRLSCPGGHSAIFDDGAAETDWWTEFSCFEYDQLWRSYHEGEQQGELVDLIDLPVCDRGTDAAQGKRSDVLLTALALFIPLALLRDH